MGIKRILTGIAVLLLLLQASCDSGKKEPAKGESASGTSSQKMISVKGSDTMVHLTSSWAEQFMAQHPDSQISVTGGGSGTGIAALLNGTTDICASSREIQGKEKELAVQKKIDLVEHTVARDGLAIIVNPANSVADLSMEQLRKIFIGEYANWKDVGGSDLPIIVLSRESSSGTFVFFQEHVLKKADYTPKARLLAGTSALVQSVQADQGAIAYVGLAYALDAKTKVKIVAVKSADDAAAVLPSDETVRAGHYPVARPLYLYTNGSASPEVQAFIDFSLSAAGQKIVTETGYISVK
ncbi:MAG: PstS family phosphate ABC transporter substrate-binding protein [Proteobacteria bacterium]|nr:PstS family phosphate ABC transporter substrate-binding protein [Pseudomonadota bacterium]MBU1648142.1 PstS family phosphate ABC transporter substrate-binding protein [Pseudomonadota bacterium]MBU1985693.1 PstS family phosphate ABC transporter substrate-binding protein [Pseudomonadota bacterium]